MSLLTQIKKDQLEARKARDTDRATLLTTVIGEATAIGKNDGNRETTDKEVTDLIGKFVKNINETINVIGDSNADRYNSLLTEKSILQQYLPTQLTEQQIQDIVQKLIDSHTAVTVGYAMSFLKEHHNGQYDGKLASTIIKNALNK